MNAPSVHGARLVLVDDHPMLRDGLRMLIEQVEGWTVCGEADNGRDGLALILDAKPDLAVIDVVLPELNGLDILRQARRARVKTEFIIFTARQSEDLVLEVFDLGARSFLLKHDPAPRIHAAITAALKHKPHFTPEVSEIIGRRLSSREAGGEKPQPGTLLTPRERETVRLLADGSTNKELAAGLNVGLRTAEGYRAAVMRKLGLKTMGNLIRYAIRNGIIEP